MAPAAVFKVLMTNESPISSEIWRSLDRLKPQIATTLCPPAAVASYLSGPKGWAVFITSSSNWQEFSPRAQAHILRAAELLCLHSTDKSLPLPAGQPHPVLLFFHQTSVHDAVASALLEVANGTALGACQVVLRGLAHCTQAGFAWSPRPNQAQSGRQSQPDDPAKTQPHLQGGGVHIGEIHVQGDFYNGDRVIVNPGQERELNLNITGQAQIYQSTTGNAVHINRFNLQGSQENTDQSAEGGPERKASPDIEIHQTAGGRQTNINRFGDEPFVGIDQSTASDQVNINSAQGSTRQPAAAHKCKVCGTLLSEGERACVSCGNEVEEE